MESRLIITTHRQKVVKSSLGGPNSAESHSGTLTINASQNNIDFSTTREKLCLKLSTGNFLPHHTGLFYKEELNNCRMNAISLLAFKIFENISHERTENCVLRIIQ